MRLDHDDTYRAYLEREARPAHKLLLDDDWRSLSEYVYDRSYVYAAGVTETLIYRLFVGRGGKYAHSYWYTPFNKETPIGLYVTHWKPLPPGVDVFAHCDQIFGPRPAKPIRSPEPLYEPDPPTARLTSVPRDLLAAMGGGAALRERAWQWSSWTLQRPGLAPEKITSRGVDRLREAVFIARDGVLPPGGLKRFHDFDWKITAAGAAWLAANVGV